MRVQQTVIVGKPLDAVFGYLMSFYRVEGGTEVTDAAAPPRRRCRRCRPGISDGHSGVASSMFNVGQQVGWP